MCLAGKTGWRMFSFKSLPVQCAFNKLVYYYYYYFSFFLRDVNKQTCYEMERYLKDEPLTTLMATSCSGALRKAESFEMLSGLHHHHASSGSTTTSSLAVSAFATAGAEAAGQNVNNQITSSSPMWPWTCSATASIKQEPSTDLEEDDEYDDTESDDARHLLRASKHDIARR